MGPDWQVTPLGCSGPISGSTLDAGCWTLDGFTAPGVGKCSCAFLGPFSMLAAAAGDVVRAKLQFAGQEGPVAPGLFEKLPSSLWKPDSGCERDEFPLFCTESHALPFCHSSDSLMARRGQTRCPHFTLRGSVQLLSWPLVRRCFQPRSGCRLSAGVQ